jgi:hypothetical protein
VGDGGKLREHPREQVFMRLADEKNITVHQRLELDVHAINCLSSRRSRERRLQFRSF